ncbi:hypothetical protein Fmac_020958 [Flemingia macrophylla]|uniref:Uncharacterized protein n=1 Tax=Flemingia macrophylla TaxID=520843 RepID=A0ABD1LVN6_9FABA
MRQNHKHNYTRAKFALVTDLETEKSLTKFVGLLHFNSSPTQSTHLLASQNSVSLI